MRGTTEAAEKSAFPVGGSNRRSSYVRLRTYAWAALPVLAVLYYCLLVAPIAPFPKLIALELIYCTPIVMTIVLSLRARTLSEGRESTFWGALSGAMVALLLCEVLLVYWVGAIDAAGPPRVSWPFHILHAVAAVFFLVGATSLSKWRDMPTATRYRWLIDIAEILLVVFVLLLQFYVLPIMGPAGATVPQTLLGVAYPLFAALMLLTTLANIVGFKVDRWRPWDRLFTISLSIYAVAVFLWPMWFPTALDTSRNYQRGVLDLVQLSGHWLLMAAAVYRLTEVTEWKLRPLPPALAREQWQASVVPGVMLVGAPVIAVIAVRSFGEVPWFGVYLGVLLLIAVLALSRNILVGLENGALFHLSVTDPLTGLYNRRFFFERLAEEIERAERYGEQLSVLSIDVDDYAAINARLGLVESDRLLRQIASLLSQRCRRECVVARLGGDDFGVIMPDVAPLEAAVAAQGLLDIIGISAGESPGAVSASAGAAGYPLHAMDAESLFQRAQGALYQAKRSGVPCAVAYDDERVPDLTATERIERLERESRLSSIHALAAALEARDPQSQIHSRGVANLSSAVAAMMGLSAESLERTATAALLHEIGLIGVPDDGSPEVEEPGAVRSEAAVVQRILGVAGLGDIAPAVRSRHEWWDGSGRPDGLASDEIPVESRIIAASHYYESAVSGTISRRPMRLQDARGAIEHLAGTRFDPTVVGAMLTVLDREAGLL